MSVQTGTKPIVEFATALLLLGVLAGTSGAATPGRRVVITPTTVQSAATTVTNIQETLMQDLTLPDLNEGSLRPQMTMPGQPQRIQAPRVQLPSKRALKMLERKRNWGFQTSEMALDTPTVENMLNLPATDDIAAMSGTREGFIEQYVRFSDAREVDRMEELGRLLRAAQLGAGLNTTPYGGPDSSKDWTDAYRTPQPEIGTERSMTTRPEIRPGSSVLPSLHRQATASTRQRDQQYDPVQAYRDYLNRTSSPRATGPGLADSGGTRSDFGKMRASTANASPVVNSPFVDLRTKPAFSSTDESNPFRAVESAVQPTAPFGDPAALRAQLNTRPAVASPLFSTPGVKPFGPLPQRDF